MAVKIVMKTENGCLNVVKTSAYFVVVVTYKHKLFMTRRLLAPALLNLIIFLSDQISYSVCLSLHFSG
jgi:hypothetical protein